jgi:Transglycosylase SLT domain
MKKLCLIVAISGLLAFHANGQTRSRIFDNFDTSRGVQVIQPKPVVIAQKKIQMIAKTQVSAKNQTSVISKKLIKKTGQQTPVMNMQDAVSMRNTSVNGQPLNKMSAGSSMSGFTTGNDTIDAYIVNSSLKYNVDPLLIYSQMHQESSFKSRAISNKGASGLMQLMPATARRFGVTNIFDQQQNIDAGIKYMRWLLDTFNQDVSLALAGYNAGEGAVMKYGYTIPPYNETQEYVRRISNRYNSIRNPNSVMKMPVKKVTVGEIAKLDKKGSAPLTTYERNPLTVRMPDGRMRLVNQ